MKVTLSSLECAKSARDALKRVGTAMDDATKRLAELTKKEPPSMRDTVAIEQIQAALKTADLVFKATRRIALAAASVGSEAVVELGDTELAALSYGLEQP